MAFNEDNQKNIFDLQGDKTNGKANNMPPSFNNGFNANNNFNLSNNQNKSNQGDNPNQKQEKNNLLNGLSPKANTQDPTSFKGKAKKKVLEEGIKKGASAFGVPEPVTSAVLNTDTGQEALNTASNAPTVAEGARQAVKVILWKQYGKYIPLLLAPLFLIFIMVFVIVNKDPFSGIGDGTDVYEELREEIKEVISNYHYKVDVDGTLILATLIGYNDNSSFDNEYNIDYLIKQVDTLANYQIITNKSCDYESNTIRQIANNDDWLNDKVNYNCVSDMEGETYTLSIEQGNYNDNNSGSTYYWNLIDDNFIFNFYNEYMVNQEKNTSENVDKINEIIDEIYLYYEFLLNSDEGQEFFKEIGDNSNFWWPVGSLEVTEVNGKLMAVGAPSLVNISSTFGWRNIGGNRSLHGAVDIAGEGQVGVHNVIASKGGVVVYPTSKSQTQFVDHDGNGYGNTDGGGYGNYVKIDHGNGEYTLYGHMARNSITVMAGDIVEQGQVIGKVGNTGNSTGAHLHFEIYIGGSSHEFRVDPLNYVSPNEPRPLSNNITTFIKAIEGGTSGSYVSGDNYVVYAGNDGTLKAGYGVVLVDKNGNKLYENYYDGEVKEGSLIPQDVVDKIFTQALNRTKALLNSYITNNNTTLNTYQYDALVSLMLDTSDEVGNLAVKAYGKNKDTTALWNVIKKYVTDKNNKENYYLKLRRAEEYELFLEGDYKYDPLSYISGHDVKYYDVKNW